MYYRKRTHQNNAPAAAAVSNAAQKPDVSDVIRPEKAAVTADDIGLMQAMYPMTAKKLLPYVKTAVESSIYDGSPVMRDIGPDRVCVNKITLEALDAAAAAYDGAEEVSLENRTEDWSSGRLLHDLAETMVLTEIFLAKRQRRV